MIALAELGQAAIRLTQASQSAQAAVTVGAQVLIPSNDVTQNVTVYCIEGALTADSASVISIDPRLADVLHIYTN